MCETATRFEFSCSHWIKTSVLIKPKIINFRANLYGYNYYEVIRSAIFCFQYFRTMDSYPGKAAGDAFVKIAA